MMTTSQKIQTSDYRGNSTSSAFQATKNLSKDDLGSVIFGCKNSTMDECITKRLFGSPAQSFSYVMNINPGMPLFLFNFTQRNLYGIFEAASSGGLNINPYAWSVNGSRTQYPAQVQVNVRLQCPPLSEKIFKPAILDNYYDQTHFWFELDHDQTRSLMYLFQSEGPISYGPHLSNNNFSRFDEIKDNEEKLEQEKEDMVIAQLVQSLEELKVLNDEQVRKIDCIEKKLMESEEQIEQLKGKCEMLEAAVQNCFQP